MHESWVVSFPESVVASLTADRVLTIQGPYGRMALRAVPAPLIAVLRRLTHPGEELGRLVEAARLTSPPGSPALPELSRAVPDGPALLAQLFHTLQHLAGQGFLTLRVVAGGTPLATLVPMGPSFVLSRDHRIEGPLILSRFAYIHREAQETLLESPLAFARVTLHDGRAAAVTHALMVPTLPTSIPDRVPGLSPETVTQLVCLLGYAGMLSPVGPDGKPHEDENPRLATWEFHDLLFHARSREGRHDAPSGNTYRFLGRLPCPPAVKTVAGVEQIELHRPDLPGLEQHDPPVATAMERRRSIREYGSSPITARQLGEFLFRVGRVRDRQEMDIETTGGVVRLEITSRPYPTGGSLFALEIYAVVKSCTDLAAGLYHYDPVGHRLGRLSGVTPDLTLVLSHAAMAAGMDPGQLQVLLVYTARFQRVAWKYSSLAYALILKDVGVLMQNMYLAAAAMGLAPCALGVGDSDRFARAIDSDYCDESSVGEFLLGSTA